jgi:hypothetical protein
MFEAQHGEDTGLPLLSTSNASFIRPGEFPLCEDEFIDTLLLSSPVLKKVNVDVTYY